MYLAKIYYFDQYFQYLYTKTEVLPGLDFSAATEFILRDCWSPSTLGIEPKYATVVPERGEAFMVVKKK